MKFEKILPLLGAVIVFIEVTEAQNCPPYMRIKNGRVKYRSRRRIAKFRCRKRFELFGAKTAVCIQNKWSHEAPKCVAARCPDIDTLDNMEIRTSYKGAVLNFFCKPGFLLQGTKQIYCNGKQWSDTVPTCLYTPPEKECDFETDTCGWTDGPDDDFDWTLHQGSTPTDRTGPSYDHTLQTVNGENSTECKLENNILNQVTEVEYLTTLNGHYLFIETSSPRKPGDVARLFSPLYDGMEAGYCFDFYYHMMGPEGFDKVGDLKVFIKDAGEDLGDLQPAFNLSGHQDDVWLRGRIELGQRKNTFQIVIAATRSSSYVSDIAIDDVRIYNCSEDGDEFEQTTIAEFTTIGLDTTTSVDAVSHTNLSKSPPDLSTVPMQNNTSVFAMTSQKEFEESTAIQTTSGSDIQRTTTISKSESKITTTVASSSVPTTPIILTKVTSEADVTSTVVGSDTFSTRVDVETGSPTVPIEHETSEAVETTTVFLSTEGLITSTVEVTQETEKWNEQTTLISPTEIEPTSRKTIIASTEQPTTTPQEPTTKPSATTASTALSTSKAAARTKTTTNKFTSTTTTPPTSSKPTTTPAEMVTTTQTTTPTTRITTATLTTTTSKTTPVIFSKTERTTTQEVTNQPIIETKTTENLSGYISTIPTQKSQPSSQINVQIVTTTRGNAIIDQTLSTRVANRTVNITDIPNVVVVDRQTSKPSGPIKPLMIGVGVGVAVGLVVVLVAIFVYLKRKRTKTDEYEDEMAPIAKNAYSEW